MTSKLALALAASLAALLLAACNGEADAPPSATASPSAAASVQPTAAPTSTAAATPASTAAATASPAVSATAAPSPAVSVTASPTASPTATATAAPTPQPRPNDAVVASTGSIPLSELDRVEFTDSEGRVTTFPIEVPPRSEYSIGFSGRYVLGERGMLFHYDKLRSGAFWMKNTHIDLAIAFVDEQFRIVEIRELIADSLDLVMPASPYRYAIETPSGWYAERAIEVGDRVRFLFELPDE